MSIEKIALLISLVALAFSIWSLVDSYNYYKKNKNKFKD